jgi:hypothetical protein
MFYSGSHPDKKMMNTKKGGFHHVVPLKEMIKTSSEIDSKRSPVLRRFSDMRNTCGIPPFETPTEIVSAGTLMLVLIERDVELRSEGGRIRWRAATGAMNLTLVRAIKRFESELLTLVEGSD